MTFSLDQAKPSVSAVLSDGLKQIAKELEAQLALDSPDQVLVMALDSLRSRYTFDKMRVVRAQITAGEDAPETDGVLSGLEKATATLKAIQSASTGSTKWVNEAAGAVDDVYGLFGKLAKL